MPLPDFTELSPRSLRSPAEVASRCCVLIGVVATGHGEPTADTVAWLQSEGLWEAASPAEQALLLQAEPNEQDKIDATWRVEALHALLWALGKLESLCPPTEPCTVEEEGVASCYLKPASEYIRTAALRDHAAIQEALTRYRDAHWEIHQAEAHNLPEPPDYVAGAIYERHYALIWLTQPGEDWDEIDTEADA